MRLREGGRQKPSASRCSKISFRRHFPHRLESFSPYIHSKISFTTGSGSYTPQDVWRITVARNEQAQTLSHSSRTATPSLTGCNPCLQEEIYIWHIAAHLKSGWRESERMRVLFKIVYSEHKDNVSRNFPSLVSFREDCEALSTANEGGVRITSGSPISLLPQFQEHWPVTRQC